MMSAAAAVVTGRKPFRDEQREVRILGRDRVTKKVAVGLRLLAAAMITVMTFSSFAFTAGDDFIKYADEMDAKMFPVFLETVQMIQTRQLEGLGKYYSNDTLADDRPDREEISAKDLTYPPLAFRMLPFNNLDTVSFPIDWKANPFNNGTWVLWYQNLRWIHDTLEKAEAGDEKSALLVLHVVGDWITSNTAWPPTNGKFVYDDHGVAERVKILNRALKLYQRSKFRDRLFHKLLLASILNHIAFLASEESYRWYNHGIMMDVALLEVCHDLDGLTMRPEVRELATRRVLKQFDYAFTTEGVHKEHSSCYHVYVTSWMLQAFKWMEKNSLSIPDRLADMIHRAAVYNTHILKPDGTFPNIGDCQDNEKSVLSDKKYYQDHPELNFSLSQGRTGIKPADPIKVFPESGVAVFRDAWPAALYAAVQADFHSKVHYQEDDTSFILTAYGKDLVIDSGLHTYDKAHPFDAYMRSARAHNVLVVDDEDFNSEPSNIGLSGMTRFFIAPSSNRSVVELTHPHYDKKNIRFLRQFGQVSKGAYLVRDIYKADDVHRYSQLFHLAPGAIVHKEGAGTLRITWPGYSHTLWLKSTFDSHEVIEGSMNPVQGWYFEKIGKSVTAPVIKLDKKEASGEFMTLLSVTQNGKAPAWELLKGSTKKILATLEKMPQRILEKGTYPTSLVPTRKIQKKP